MPSRRSKKARTGKPMTVRGADEVRRIVEAEIVSKDLRNIVRRPILSTVKMAMNTKVVPIVVYIAIKKVSKRASGGRLGGAVSLPYSNKGMTPFMPRLVKIKTRKLAIPKIYERFS